MEKSEELFATLSSGVTICYQTFGKPSDPAIVIINGFGTSMIQKPDAFMEMFSPKDDPRFIIRYDHRDTGRSSSIPSPQDGSAAYSLADMADDVVGLVDHLKLDKVHLIGSSMGGPISFIAAGQKFPDRVKSLTILFSSPTGSVMNEGDNLPPMKPEGMVMITDMIKGPADVTSDESWIDFYVKTETVACVEEQTDEEKAKERATARLAYGREKESGTVMTKTNHAGAAGARWPREALKGVKCPTLVVHADKDQYWQIEHSEALRDEVSGPAKLLVLQNCGHEFPERIWRPLADGIVDIVKEGELRG